MSQFIIDENSFSNLQNKVIVITGKPSHDAKYANSHYYQEVQLESVQL